jgi:hypothetical protein
LAVTAVAVASDQFTQSAKVNLTSKKTGKSVGVKAALRATDPGEEGGKPKAAKKIVIKLPKGTRIDKRAVAQCNLADEDVIAGKCKRKSLIGTGKAKANVAPLIATTTEDVKAYASRQGLVLLLTDNERDPAPAQTIVLRAKATKKGVIKVNVPELQPLPGVFAVLTDFSLKTKPKGKGKGKKRKNFITSPQKCNTRKGWVSTVTFTYVDGSKKDVRKTKQKCRG